MISRYHSIQTHHSSNSATVFVDARDQTDRSTEIFSSVPSLVATIRQCCSGADWLLAAGANSTQLSLASARNRSTNEYIIRKPAYIPAATRFRGYIAHLHALDIRKGEGHSFTVMYDKMAYHKCKWSKHSHEDDALWMKYIAIWEVCNIPGL